MTFVNGLFYKQPHPKAPNFVLGNLSAKRDELIAFLTAQEGEWVNMVINQSKGGKIYIVLDEWKPKQREEKQDDVYVGDEKVPF